MTANALRLMVAKRLRVAIKEATAGRVTNATVFSLRHSHASALHYAGYTVPEAARRMGHGGALHLRTYAHVIDSISGQRYDGLDAPIASARADLDREWFEASPVLFDLLTPGLDELLGSFPAR
jgi:integrase